MRLSTVSEKPILIRVGESTVSGLLRLPETSRACFVFAHGAGVGMRHRFMSDVAEGLAARGIGTLRYQFPYMERGSKRPDSPKIAQGTVRAAVHMAKERMPGLPLVAGGKSYGARMTSQAQAEAPLSHVRGLAFLGFPLHPPGTPSDKRAEHLAGIQIPMLFLQGTRDDFADMDHLRSVCGRLGERAELSLFEGADHSFHIRAKSGRTDEDIMVSLLNKLSSWIDGRAGGNRAT